MLIKGGLSELSCIVYLQWRLFSHASGKVFTHVIQYFTSSALLLLCLLQCVKGNYYLNVGLVNPFLCQKKRAIITPF